ncbi:hypothetical protein SK803_37375 [Lentzea sp. BCCO 10_0856]|uniref:PknH-like extracellular domain-containing protein n=1 Tax=Lentzea miocenica TaxID=3095431 RepID=A0ABU4TDD1_9PSEU|nr:hypothetical protein [Lentzea sp. BCCO 10_0856]MDX8035903.1 hypothetical protein [Lentzea sp. BCCO 10_0856]
MAVLLAGCGAQEAAAPPSSPSPTSSSVSVPDQWNQLAARAEKTYVPKDAFLPDAPWNRDHPATPGGYEDTTQEVSTVCGGLKISSGFKVSRNRLWRGEHTVVWQDVHALSADKAAMVVEQIQAKARSCATYARTAGKPERAVTPDVAVTPPTGFDGFYAFCETATDIKPGQLNCQALLARGDLLVGFGSNVVSDDPAHAQATALRQLHRMMPVVAQALAAV